MAALTVSSTKIFGARGAHCDAQVMKMVEYSREFDFGETNVADNANYELLPIPAGFLATHIVVKQETATDQDVTLTFATLNDATKAVGGNFALKDLSGETALCFDCQPVKSTAGYAGATSGASTTTVAISVPEGMFFGGSDMLCMKVPDGLTSEKIAKGRIRVSLVGYQVGGASLAGVNIGTLTWATGQSADDAAANKSGGDPMFRQPEYA